MIIIERDARWRCGVVLQHAVNLDVAGGDIAIIGGVAVAEVLQHAVNAVRPVTIGEDGIVIEIGAVDAGQHDTLGLIAGNPGVRDRNAVSLADIDASPAIVVDVTAQN